jgi:hypothetical protein
MFRWVLTFTQEAQSGQAIHDRHHHVHQDHIKMLNRQAIEGLLPIVGSGIAVTHPLQHDLGQLAVDFMILHQED